MGIIIENSNILLREITYGDTANILKWRNSQEVKKYFIYQKEITETDHQNWLDTKVKSGEVVQFIIHIKRENIDIGSVYLQDIDNRHKKCEFGIFIGEVSMCGKGIGKEVARLVTTYAFDTLGMNKVYLRLLAKNRRAYKSYLDAGFVDEGYFKQDVWINGIPEDVIFMATFAERKKND